MDGEKGVAGNMTNRSQSPDKSRQDWVIGALAALTEGGIDAVKVERIAVALGVSKGSFYWHFKDRADLLTALLDLWDADFTQQLIEDAAPLATPADRLRAIAKDALATTMHGVDSARAESAVQAWAAVDEKAAARLRRIEAARVGYLVQELETHGLSTAKAGAMAKALYLALLGLYATRAYNADLADDRAFLDLVELVLAEP